VAGSCNKSGRENSVKDHLMFCVCVCMRTLVVVNILFSHSYYYLYFLCFEIGLEIFHPHETQLHGLSSKTENMQRQ